MSGRSRSRRTPPPGAASLMTRRRMRCASRSSRRPEMHEALAYDFDELKPESTLVTLRWEKVAVPFRVAVDQQQTLQNVRAQFRDLPQYTWESWNDAAQYCATNKTNLDEALKCADRSIKMKERFHKVTTNMSLLEGLNRPTEAAAARSRAMELGNAQQLY